jgi:hypothetical protein
MPNNSVMKKLFTMKQLIVAVSFITCPVLVWSQNVGIGTATPSGKLEVLQTGSTPGLRIQINNPASLTPGVFIVSNAQGSGLEAISTATTGVINGAAGVVSSSSNGNATSGVTGVLGISNAQNSGFFSAGVRGINNATNGFGFGVLGYHASTGYGVYGIGGRGAVGFASGSAAVGVLAIANEADDIAMVAQYIGTGAGKALVVENGKVSATGTNRFAFRHLVTAQNVLASVTTIDHPFCNGDANAILIVTHEYRSPDSEKFVTNPFGVRYNGTKQKWEIFIENQAGLVVGTLFNVMVVN